MPILYILCGPSGSGKSTWAKTDERMRHCAYVSRDEVRLSFLKDGEEYFAHEKEVFAKFVNIIANYLIDGFDTIADATHLNMFSRCKLMQALDRYTHNYQIICVTFDTDADTCVARNANRTGRANVPENVIRNMCRNFRMPTKNEDDRIIDIIEVSDTNE